MKVLAERARKVAVTDSTVLISGESGTGKEVLCAFIHSFSRRGDEPMVKLNCGAIPESLIESELFGHKKGSFTGAVSDYTGKLQAADGGTLFLDEVGELPLQMQVKLLRFLENGELQRIGETRTMKVDVRIIAATNKELQEEVGKGTFREDLFYRLNVFPLLLPPLRERRKDIVLLADHFLEDLSLRMGIPKPIFDQEAADRLQSLPLNGNVRELRSIVERILILSSGMTITEDEVMEAVSTGRENNYQELFQTTMPLSKAKQKLELGYIRAQLALYGDSVQKTAEALGILPNNLSRRVKQLEEQADDE